MKMNLKYYLRGLGIGIIVTALILGIHYSKTSSMTDAQVKERAAKLGMVESSTLVSKEEVNAEKLLEELNKEENEKKSDEELLLSDSSVETDADSEQNDQTEVTPENDEAQTVTETEAPAVDTEVVIDAQDDPDKKTDAQTSDENEITEQEAEENIEESQDIVSSNDGIKITVSSGDSSYTVAKKLVGAGIISDASEFDTFLCQKGYDRYIRTGDFTIPADASNDAIAKIITGR